MKQEQRKRKMQKPILTWWIIACFIWATGSISQSAIMAQSSEQNPYPFTLTWSPDGSKIATSGDGFIRVWDASTQAMLLDLPVGATYVHNHAWSPDGTRLASASADQFLRIWNISGSGHVPGELLAQIGPVSDIGFLRYVDWSQDGSVIATASTFEGASVRFWDANTYQLATTFGLGWLNIIALNPDPSKNQIAYAGDEEGPKVATLTEPLIGSVDPVGGRDVVARAFAWNSDGTQLAVSYEDGEVHVWDIATNNQVAVMSAGDGIIIWSLAWGTNDETIATASGDGTIRVWDSATGELLQSTAPLTGVVLDFNPTGTELAYAVLNTSVIISSVTQISNRLRCIEH